MAILLLFEKSDSLSYRELQETTNILEDQFPRYLQSLLDSKLLICFEVRTDDLVYYFRHYFNLLHFSSCRP